MFCAFLMVYFTVGCKQVPVQQPPTFFKGTFAIKHISTKLIELVLHSYRHVLVSTSKCKQSDFGKQWHLV